MRNLNKHLMQTLLGQPETFSCRTNFDLHAEATEVEYMLVENKIKEKKTQ